VQKGLSQQMKIQKLDLPCKGIGQLLKFLLGEEFSRAPRSVAKGAAEIAGVGDLQIRLVYFSHRHAPFLRLFLPIIAQNRPAVNRQGGLFFWSYLCNIFHFS
jgi:hypothetical protein